MISVLGHVNTSLDICHQGSSELDDLRLVPDLLVLLGLSQLLSDLSLGLRYLLGYWWLLVELLLDLLNHSYQRGVLVPPGHSWTLVEIVDAAFNVLVLHSCHSLDLWSYHRESFVKNESQVERSLCHLDGDGHLPELLIALILHLLHSWEGLLQVLDLLSFPTSQTKSGFTQGLSLTLHSSQTAVGCLVAMVWAGCSSHPDIHFVGFD